MSGLRAQERPHVAFVMSSLPMGGAQTQFVSLLAWGAAHRSDWRVTLLLLTAECDVTLRARLAEAGVTVVTVERRGRPFAAFFVTLVRWFRSHRPDVVHTVLSGSAGTWGRLAARLTRTRRIVHSERSLTPRRTRLQRMLEPILHRFTDRFFTNAHAIAARLETEGVPHERVAVLRNGVDLARFADATPHLREAWGVSEGDVVAGFLGMLRPVKRPDLVLDALLLLPEQDRPDLMVFAGDGVMMPGMATRVHSNPWMRDHVLLLGMVPDSPAFLAAIDFLVLASDTEGLPNAIIEAMAAGKPCVATRVSDVPDLVTDNGWVVPPNDAASLADAMRDVRHMDRSARRSLGERGRRRAIEAFGLAVAAKRFWDAHDVLLQEVEPPS